MGVIGRGRAPGLPSPIRYACKAPMEAGVLVDETQVDAR